MEGSATNRGFLAPFSFCFDLSSSKASKADMVATQQAQKSFKINTLGWCYKVCGAAEDKKKEMTMNHVFFNFSSSS